MVAPVVSGLIEINHLFAVVNELSLRESYIVALFVMKPQSAFSGVEVQNRLPLIAELDLKDIIASLEVLESKGLLTAKDSGGGLRRWILNKG